MVSKVKKRNMRLDKGDNLEHRPLDGVRVLDFTRILSGPYVTLLMADMGAEVIKIERPELGDDTRWWGPPFLDRDKGISAYFACLNRDKRSVAIDLSTREGQNIVRELAGVSEIVIENFRPNVAERIGIDHKTLHRLEPHLVTCSISGFGHAGAYSELPGTEIVVEAMSGLMDATGPTGGDPVRFGVAMVDITTGLTAAVRVVAALMRARETGVGTHIECSLYSSALAVLGTLITSYTATGQEPRRWGTHHPTICPYGGFPTKDGHIILGVINDRSWPAFCEAIGLPELLSREDLLTNAGRVRERQELEAVIEATCRTQSTSHWIEQLHTRGLLAAPIRTVGEAVGDPNTISLDLFVPLSGFPGVLAPRLDGQRAEGSRARVPSLGGDTEDVLMSLLGRSDSEIATLAKGGVISTGVPPQGVRSGVSR